MVAVQRGVRPYRALGQRIQELRSRAQLSQRELAERVGISIGYPGRIETGRNRPDPHILKRIAEVLDADYTELAALAGYIDAPAGSVVDIRVDAAKASVLRRLAAYPADLLLRLERAARILFLESVPPQELDQQHYQDDVQEQAGHDEPDWGSENPA